MWRWGPPHARGPAGGPASRNSARHLWLLPFPAAAPVAGCSACRLLPPPSATAAPASRCPPAPCLPVPAAAPFSHSGARPVFCQRLPAAASPLPCNVPPPRPLLRWPWSPPAGGQVEGHLRCPRRCRFPWKPAAAPPPPPPPQPSAEVAPLLRRAPWPCHPSPPSLAVVAAGHPTCGYSSATGSARLGPSPRPPHWHTPHRRHRHRRSVDHLTPHGLEKIQQKTNTYNSYAANQAAHGAAHRSP